MLRVVSARKHAGGSMAAGGSATESIVAPMDQSRPPSAADMHVGPLCMRGGKFPWPRVHRQAKDL